jgi:hypothetical protein
MAFFCVYFKELNCYPAFMLQARQAIARRATQRRSTRNAKFTSQPRFCAPHPLIPPSCIQQQPQSKFQTSHLKAAQSNPDLQSDPSGPLRSLIR